MIDIHSHVLPAQDDGPQNLDQAVAMLQMAAQAGTTDIVATPHAGLEYAFCPESIETRIGELQAAAGPLPKIHYGSEMRLTPDCIDDAVAHPERYTIAHGPYLLVEFADTYVPKTAGRIFDEMLARGIRPMVAHPERNPILRGRLTELERWVEQGCLVQITAGSLLGRFGTSACTAAHQILRRELAHLVASDAHDTRHRPPLLDEAGRYVRHRFGARAFERLLVENPRAVIEGRDLDVHCAEPERHKNWFVFW